MKKIAIFTSLVILVGIFAISGLAKETQNNGNPFQEIWDAIKSIKSEIEDIRDIINDIENPPRIVPIGSIVAWHKSFENTPELQEGWVEMNGQILNDTESPYYGQVIPNLNGDARFLRGGIESGELQPATQHPYLIAKKEGIYYSPDDISPRFIDSYISGNLLKRSSQNAQAEAARGQSYTSRPINMVVVWIMRVK